MERGIDMKKKLGALLLACLMMFTVAAVPASAAATSPIVQVTAGNAQAPFDAVIYRPYTEIKGGFVFYPGAMVDYRDYGPLLTAIARQGYLIISVEFPLDFAFANSTNRDTFLRCRISLSNRVRGKLWKDRSNKSQCRRRDAV